MSDSWIVTLVEADDGSGDLVIPFTDEQLAAAGWEMGDTYSRSHCRCRCSGRSDTNRRSNGYGRRIGGCLSIGWCNTNSSSSSESLCISSS